MSDTGSTGGTDGTGEHRGIDRRTLLRGAALAAAAAAAGCAPSGSSGSSSAGTPKVVASASGLPATAAPPSPAASTAPSADAPQPTPQSTGPAVEVGHGPRDKPLVALTFHGAGDRALGRALLKELADAQVKVTVLAVGTWLDEQPDTARAVLDGGHELGNHTWHHQPMRQLGAQQAYTEVVGCAERLRGVTGSAQRWFRASGTQHTTPTIRAAAARAGYRTCLSYDVDSLDWQDPGAATVERAVLGNVQNGSIVSLHLGHRVTLTALPAILSGLSRKGLRPVTVSELLA
ncbi:MAG TPA: polysaccharide deacetylase family protein [Motilibacteraceae bacterium]|nr:polysaccharide deacetylase family protein [Motilibacteraceae bacterium]